MWEPPILSRNDNELFQDDFLPKPNFEEEEIYEENANTQSTGEPSFIIMSIETEEPSKIEVNEEHTDTEVKETDISTKDAPKSTKRRAGKTNQGKGGKKAKKGAPPRKRWLKKEMQETQFLFLEKEGMIKSIEIIITFVA